MKEKGWPQGIVYFMHFRRLKSNLLSSQKNLKKDAASKVLVHKITYASFYFNEDFKVWYKTLIECN